MTRSLKKVARTFETVRFLYNLYLCPLIVSELLYEKKSASTSTSRWLGSVLWVGHWGFNNDGYKP